MYVFAGVMCLVSLGIAYGYQRKAPRPSWEYFSVGSNESTFKGDATLNELGKQGWELVATYSGEGNGVGVRLYFKRRK
jgi:hypothetical protein